MAHSIAWAALIVVAGAFLPAASAQEIAFGDDSSDYARDGECDDRRFRGTTMASVLSADNTGHDATDCRRGYVGGALRLWDPAAARAATDCARVDFGDDRSEWARDGECDDIRFEGTGMAEILVPEDTFADATDCRQLCRAGRVSLRDYD
jgi:hypothetical protein